MRINLAMPDLSPADREWLRSAFDRNRAMFGDLRMEAPTDPPGAVPAGEPVAPAANPVPAVGPNGYPVDTRPADMSPEHQVAYWRHKSHQNETAAKAHEKRVKELEPAQATVAALEEAARSDAEKAALKARSEGEEAGRAAAAAEAAKLFGGQLVESRLDAAAAGKGMTGVQLRTLAGDASRFVGAEGVDTVALDAFLAALPDKTPTVVRPGLGGGNRPSATASGTAQGADLWAQSHKKKTSPA